MESNPGMRASILRQSKILTNNTPKFVNYQNMHYFIRG